VGEWNEMEWNSGGKSDKFLNHYHPHPLLSLQGMALEYPDVGSQRHELKKYNGLCSC